MTRRAELKLTLLDPRPCQGLLTDLEQALQRMRFRIQEQRSETSKASTTLKTVEQAHWWNSDVGSRLPIWIELQLQPADSGTRLQLTASLSLLNLMAPGWAQALLRSRVVRLCRLAQLPLEQVQMLLDLHARFKRRRLMVLALVALLGLVGGLLSIREGGNAPDQPGTSAELNSVIP